ncbi:hypothetical protein [Helicobacter sp. T3_23-1056]
MHKIKESALKMTIDFRRCQDFATFFCHFFRHCENRASDSWQSTTILLFCRFVVCCHCEILRLCKKSQNRGNL